MSTITTRAAKGSPLTHDELDLNFTNLNTDKLENITGESIGDLSDVDITSTAPNTGEGLIWNGSQFVPGAVDASTKVTAIVDNKTAGSLTKGTPVHITGATGNTFHVIAARADTASAMPAAGVLAQTLAPDEEGVMIISGFINGVNTLGFTAGDEIYVGATGGYTNTPPTGEGNLIQKLGVVSVIDETNGAGLVQGAGRTNAMPNLNEDQFFLGNSSNVAVSTDFSTAVEAISINAVSEDSAPSLGGNLNVLNNTISSTGANSLDRFVLGTGSSLVSTTNNAGPTLATEITNYTGANRLQIHGSISKTTLGANISVSNGRIRHNETAVTVDLNSYNFTSSGTGRGITGQHTGFIILNNTGSAPVTVNNVTSNRANNLYVAAPNVSIVDYKALEVQNVVEFEQDGCAVTNQYGILLNNNVGDDSPGGATVTNKYSIFSNNADYKMVHSGPVQIGSYTLPTADGLENYVLTTNGAGVVSWAAAGGGSSFTGDLAGNSLQDSTNSTISVLDPMTITTDTTHTALANALRINLAKPVDGPSIEIRAVNGEGNFNNEIFLRSGKDTSAVTGSWPRLTFGSAFNDVASGSTTTPNQSIDQQLRRVYYNSNVSAWRNVTQTIYRYGTDGFFGTDTARGTPANQRISWGVPMDMQESADARYVFNTGDQAVFSIVNSAGNMIRNINIESGSGVANYVCIPDAVWTDTGSGTYSANWDPFWGFGVSWKITITTLISSFFTNSTITVNNALPPSGSINNNFGGTVTPLYVNTPAWADTANRTVTMTRPGSGTTFYRWTIEWGNSRLFTKDWESWTAA